MALALSTFFTSQNLAGDNRAANYGFNVTDVGVGAKIVNVGRNGAAFDVADFSNITISALLLATNRLTGTARNGTTGYATLYDIDGDGLLSEFEKSLREMANDVYSAINGIG
ncbi:MAG: hypothetical protein KDB03_23940 [Planctomycetales bacterium]|nr:hypothetical protein [Planctomycetales bacterium]